MSSIEKLNNRELGDALNDVCAEIRRRVGNLNVAFLAPKPSVSVRLWDAPDAVLQIDRVVDGVLIDSRSDRHQPVDCNVSDLAALLSAKSIPAMVERGQRCIWYHLDSEYEFDEDAPVSADGFDDVQEIDQDKVARYVYREGSVDALLAEWVCAQDLDRNEIWAHLDMSETYTRDRVGDNNAREVFGTVADKPELRFYARMETAASVEDLEPLA